MNKKGQVELGSIMYVFIAVIVGVIIFTAIAQQVGTTTNTVAVANESYTASVNGGSFYITNYRAMSDVVIWNSTTQLITSNNYTVNNNVIYNGALAVNISVDGDTYESGAWKVSGTAQPLTYIADSGARSMAGLIVIFFALLVAAVALSPVMRSGALELIGK